MDCAKGWFHVRGSIYRCQSKTVVGGRFGYIWERRNKDSWKSPLLRARTPPQQFWGKFLCGVFATQSNSGVHAVMGMPRSSGDSLRLGVVARKLLGPHTITAWLHPSPSLRPQPGACPAMSHVQYTH